MRDKAGLPDFNSTVHHEKVIEKEKPRHCFSANHWQYTPSLLNNFFYYN